jgi:hypothetical protein
MGIGKKVFAMMTLAATAACQQAPAIDPGIAGARAVEYTTIRDASGVLGYAEPLLGPALATKYQVGVGKGAAAVDPSVVAGAWELPLGTTAEAVAQALRAHGSLDRIRDQDAGQLWIADFSRNGERPLRMLLLNGADPAWERRAAPEVRPGAHVYLIAYRT